MQERHKNRMQYFDEQAYTTQKYVMPFINQSHQISNTDSVLEIGCGEAGNLKPFLALGCKCVGVDISENRIENGKRFYQNAKNSENLTLLVSDIYDLKNVGTFDIIIIRDVIEHIHNQEIFIKKIADFMNEKTIVFVAFPPWQNPFGGHQQNCDSKLLSHLPYFHILPKGWYKKILTWGGEDEAKVDSLLEIKDTRISIERFKRIISEDFDVKSFTYYIINPNYEVKFGLKPWKSYVLKYLPYFRNYFTTCIYCTFSKK